MICQFHILKDKNYKNTREKQSYLFFFPKTDYSTFNIAIINQFSQHEFRHPVFEHDA